MNKIKRSIILLLGYLAALFALSWVKFGNSDIFQISPLLSIWGLMCTALIILGTPRNRHSSMLLLYLTGYFITRQVILQPQFQGVPFHIFIICTECFMLCGLLWVAGQFAARLDDYQAVIDKIAGLDQNGRVSKLSGSIKDIKIEMTRSRRNGMPLGFVVLEPDAASFSWALDKAAIEIGKLLHTRYCLTRLGSLLEELLRRTDLIIEVPEKKQFLLICPETDIPKLDFLVERIEKAVSNNLGIAIKSGTAYFPQESLTFEELLEKATSRIELSKHFGEVPPETSTIALDNILPD